MLNSESLRHVLVPTDFSTSANCAFSFALILARAGGADVHLMHDVEVPSETITAATIIREELHAAKADAAGKMKALIESNKAADVVAERAIEHYTNPVLSIPYYAKEHDVDLIVMGTHGHTSLREKLIGSRAERVLRDAPCPVVTVPAPENRPLPDHILRILLPVDFSDSSTEALQLSCEIALMVGGRVSLLHAGDWDNEKNGHESLRRLYTEVVGRDDPVETFLSREDPADAITTLSDEAGIDLIIMPTHGRTGVRRALTRNITDAVVAHAPCPVLTVRTDLLHEKAQSPEA